MLISNKIHYFRNFQTQNYTIFLILKNKCQTNLLFVDAFVKKRFFVMSIQQDKCEFL